VQADIRHAYDIHGYKPQEKNHLGDLGVDGMITLKYNFETSGVKMGIGFILLQICQWKCFLRKI
jgi:hypothetical protein